MDGGSPLAVHTAALADAVQARLPGWRVDHAMRYGSPSMADAFARLRASGVRKVRVLPLYPQYSTTTTASVADAIATDAGGLQVAMLNDYHRDPGWAAAVAGSIGAHWAATTAGEPVRRFSMHLQRLVIISDPYAAHCEASTLAIADALGIPRAEILLTFQSRFGREQWLQPYTQATLQALARDGVRTLDVACPGFAVDCPETLEEIAVENAEAFRRGRRPRPCATSPASTPAPRMPTRWRAWRNGTRAGPDARIQIPWIAPAASPDCATMARARACWRRMAGSTMPPASCRWRRTCAGSTWS